MMPRGRTVKKSPPGKRPRKARPVGYDRPDYVPGFVFDQRKADRVIRFIQTFCIHSKGQWAGQPFQLMEWQKRDILEPLFGWVDPEGRRRYRTAAIFTPKKQGKSTLLSALALYFLFADGEPGAEVYSAAADRFQAGIIARECFALAKSSPFLSKNLEVVESRNTIIHRQSFSRYSVLSGDNFRAEGINASAILFDELHAQRDRRLFDALRYAGAARRQSCLISISTAGFDRSPNAIWWDQWTYAERVAADPGVDPTFFGKIYAAPEQADPEKYFDRKLWHKANPSLGITVSEESFAADAAEARARPAALNSWLRYRLNVPTQSDVRWFSPEVWAEGDKPPPVPLAGRKCWLGLDLASTYDITALVAVFPSEDGTFDVDCRFFIPRKNAAERELRDRIPYAQWLREGWIIGTDGDICDYGVVREHIREYAAEHQVMGLAADRWNAAATMTQVQGDGVEVYGYSQGFGSMAAPSRLLENLVVGRKLRHRSPVLSWMAANVAVQEDANGNIRPSKKASTEKIDGIVALCMALGLHSSAQVTASQSWEIVEI
jgi:phage terminase large subunit-like protein